jgi:hypothetical protein
VGWEFGCFGIDCHVTNIALRSSVLRQ